MSANTEQLESKPSLPTTIDILTDDTEEVSTAGITDSRPSHSSQNALKRGQLSWLPNLDRPTRAMDLSTIQLLRTARPRPSHTASLHIDTDVTGTQVDLSDRTVSPETIKRTHHPGAPTLRRAETDKPHVTYSPGSSLYRSTNMSPLSRQTSLGHDWNQWTSTTVDLKDQETADRFWDRNKGGTVKRDNHIGSPVQRLHRTLRSVGSFDSFKASTSPSSPGRNEEIRFLGIHRKRTKEDDKEDAEMFAMVCNPEEQVGGPVIGIPEDSELGSDEDSGAEPDPAPEADPNRSSLAILGERFSVWGKT